MRSEGFRGSSWKVAAAIGLVLAVAGAAPAAAQSSLKSRRDFGVGDRPLSGIAVDYDGDGFLDLVTANRSSNDISLVKGFGDGTFRRATQVPVGSQPSSVATADFNGDGIPDLVTGNLLSQDVTVVLGTGMGRFGSPLSKFIAAAPSSIAAGDWNADGKMDVATSNAAQNTITVLLGDGTGRFGTPRTLAVGIAPQQLVTADVNKDLKPDLVVVNNGSTSVQVWRGNGDGTFSLATTLSTGAGTSPIALTVADFNADTLLDIAVSLNGNDTVAVYQQSSNGNFETPRILTPGAGPRGLAAADINRDGKLDLVVTLFRVSGEGAIATLNGDGTGAFPTSPTTNATGPFPNFVLTGDFNRDGNPDIATVNLSGNTVSVLQNTGTGAFVVANKITLPIGSFPQALVAADFNGDGKNDIASANEFPNTVSFAPGDGAGGFTSVNSANNVGITPFSMTGVDFNRDGKMDLVTANNGDDTYSLLANAGTGNFTVTNGSSAGCVGPVGVDSGELSGDLIADLGIICETPGYFCTLGGTGSSGAAAFGTPVCTAVDGTPEGIRLGLYNQDGLNDAGMALRDANAAGIGFSNGFGGLLDIPALFPVGTAPIGIARGDLNGDLIEDLVLANSGSNSISALLGDGGGAFSFPALNTPVGLAPTAVAIADFNLDGKKDVAAVNTDANNVTLLLGDGFGHFSNAGVYGTRDLPVAIVAKDFNSDGKPDLAVADNFNDTITIMLNQSAAGDPLASLGVINGSSLTVFRWGIVPGGVYDVIKGQVKSVTQGSTTFNLGAVTCLADDSIDADTSLQPDNTIPPLGNSYFYAVRAIVNGVPGDYTVSAPANKPGVPGSGGCP